MRDPMQTSRAGPITCDVEVLERVVPSDDLLNVVVGGLEAEFDPDLVEKRLLRRQQVGRLLTEAVGAGADREDRGHIRPFSDPLQRLGQGGEVRIGVGVGLEVEDRGLALGIDLARPRQPGLPLGLQVLVALGGAGAAAGEIAVDTTSVTGVAVAVRTGQSQVEHHAAQAPSVAVL